MSIIGDTEIPNLNINMLPDEMLLCIFKLLPLEGILVCKKVCKRWRKLSNDPAVWRNILIVYSGHREHHRASERKLRIMRTHGQYLGRIKFQYIHDYIYIKLLLSKLVNIVSLELVMCRVSGDFCEDLKAWPRLRKLNLKNTLLLFNSIEMLFNFEEFKCLRYLELADFGLSSVNCSSLLHCVYLSQIYIEKIKSLTLDDVQNIILSKQKILRSLRIYGGDAVNDKCLHLLAQCKCLRDLGIIRCENLTDKGLVAVGKMKLQHLQIWNNVTFSEKVLYYTLRNPNMFKINSLSFSRIGNMSPLIVDVISEYYKCIKFIAMYQCPRIIHTDYEKQLKSKFRNIDVVLY